MSKVFIPTANVGKAHDADIYSVCVTNPYTITCGGDGYLKLWSNKLPEDGAINAKDHVKSQFVHASGLHHVDALYTVESHGAGTLLIIATVSFSGEIFFYQLSEDGLLKEIQLLSKDPLKSKSFWAIRWGKSEDLALSHRFTAVDVKGNTYVWKFHPFTNEIDETIKEKKQNRRYNEQEREDISKEENQTEEEWELDFHFTYQGEIPSKEPLFATCVSISTVNDLIATGFASGTVIVSQLSTLRPLYTFEGFGIQGINQNSNSVRSIEFSPAGTLLAVANDSGSYGCVTIYETEYGERIGNLTVPTHSGQSNIGSFAHDGWVFDLSFNPTGEFIASCGYDSKLRVWDVKTRERVSTLNISAGDIEIEEDILLQDENGDSLKNPPVFSVTFFNKGIRTGMGSETNEGLCCVCMDRSVRWYREAGGS